MKKQQLSAIVLATAICGAMIGCGQDNEINQSVPDNVIDIAKSGTTTTLTSASNPYTTTTLASTVSGSNTSDSESSTSSSTTTSATIQYVGVPNATVRQTEVVTEPVITTTAPIITTTTTEWITTEESAIPTEPPTETTETTTTVTLVAPNAMFTPSDVSFTYQNLHIQPGESYLDFRTALETNGISFREELPYLICESFYLELEEDNLTIKSITINGEGTTTEKGVAVKDTFDTVKAAYGEPMSTEEVPMEDGSIRIIYHYTIQEGTEDYLLDITFDADLVSQICYQKQTVEAVATE